MTELVDGERPAVDWVCRLPRVWTTTGERLLLIALALDSYDREPPFTCSPSTTELAARCGWFKSDLTAAVASLEAPRVVRVRGKEELRPALLELERGHGRKRTTYRLRTEHGPQLWAASGRESLDHNESVDNPLVVGGIPTTTPDVAVGQMPTATSGRDTPDHNDRSGRASGRVSGRADPDHSLSLPQEHPPSVVGEAQESAPAASVGGGNDLDKTLELLGRFAGQSAANCRQAVREQLDRGWRPEQLAEHVRRGGKVDGAHHPAAALRSRVERLGPPPAAVAPWCGACHEKTRVIESPDGPARRCPNCHPNRAASRAASKCPDCARLIASYDPSWRCSVHEIQLLVAAP